MRWMYLPWLLFPWLFIVWVLCFDLPAFGQDVELRYAPARGSRMKYVHTITTNSQFESEKARFGYDQKIEIEESIEIANVRADGALEVKHKIERMKIYMDGALVFDSAGTAGKEEFAQLKEQLVGKEFTSVVSARGESAAGRTLANALKADAPKEQIAPLALTQVVLPTDKIRSGSTWKQETKFDDLGDLRAMSDYAVAELNEQSAVLKCETRITPGQQPKDVEIRKSSGITEARFDRKAGVVASVVSRFHIELKTNGVTYTSKTESKTELAK